MAGRTDRKTTNNDSIGQACFDASKFEGRRQATSNCLPRNKYGGKKAVTVVVSVEGAPSLMTVRKLESRAPIVQP